MKKVILNSGIVCFFGNKEDAIKKDEFSYMMLARLIYDLDYFLGFGNRNNKHLWAGSIKDQFQEIEKLYKSIIIKPEWVSLAQIREYKRSC